jgi:hypothetical protein
MSNLSYRVSLALFVLAACNTGSVDQTGSATDDDASTTGGSTGQTTQTTLSTTQATEPTSTTDVPTTTIGETDTTADPGTTGSSGSNTTTTGSTSDATGSTSETSETGSTGGGPTCDDGEKNGDETDTDCGGATCSPCADGLACLMDSDCEVMSCVQNTCGLPPPGCMDGQQNGDETDVDCGGPSCDTCADTLKCVEPTDCNSKNCKDGLCAPAACDDTIQNGSETDVDCGGFDCGACSEGETCNADADCDTNSCADKVCVAATCQDGKVNQDETDVDCGGPNCDKCGDGLGCVLPADCTSGVCDDQMKTCAAASCMDNVKNGAETDVDCGGDCKPCSVPGLVINEVDYDQVNTDSAEFVEILNNTGAPYDLANHALVLVNGNGNVVYLTLSLAAAGTLDPGQYLIVANANFVVPPEAKKVNFAKANDNIENGAPDGLAIVDTATMKVVDALSYEGSITMVNIANVGMVSLVEGTALPMNLQDSNAEAGSFSRLPNGYDGNNAATDWKLSKTPTPAAANVP